MKTLSQIKNALSAHCRPYGCDECDYEKKIFCRDMLLRDINEFLRQTWLPQWIPVAYSLPSDGENVIVFARHGDVSCIDLGFVINGKWHTTDEFASMYATHWIRFPHPPQESEP